MLLPSLQAEVDAAQRSLQELGGKLLSITRGTNRLLWVSSVQLLFNVRRELLLVFFFPLVGPFPLRNFWCPYFSFCAVESFGSEGQQFTSVVVRKEKICPKKYPRSPGTPKKSPL
jgi:hypothetical protein